MTATKLTPANVLIDLVSTLLAPMFLLASNGDIALARNAAIQTMNAYRIQSHADLLTVAQIVAFSLAALGSLGLSMDDDLSLSLVLRLRGNANACNRSAEKLRRVLRESHEAVPPPAPEEHRPAPPPSAPQPQPPAATPVPAQPQPMTPDQQRRAAWAAAFTEVAAECAAELPHLPPEEQKAASIRVAALNSSASALLSGVPLPRGASGHGIPPNALPSQPT